MKPTCLAMLFACFALTAAAADDIIINRVVGPEKPGPYKHPASIAELDNGDLFIAYYCGEGEYAVETAVWGIRLKKGADEWSEPVIIADTPWRSEGNPVVWQAPDGLVWLFYVNRFGDTWSTSRVKAKVSEDNGYTWSDSFLLTMDEGTMVQGAPVVLDNGDYMLPIYDETGHDTENVGADSNCYFLRYNPATETWTETGRINADNGCLQANLAQVDGDYLVAYTRRGGGYEPTDDGYMLRSESRDGGQTWTRAVQSSFKNPNAAIAFMRLKSGNLMLVYNDSMNERTPLTVSISTDGDKTWPHKRDIMTGDNTFAYPYAVQGSDGRIHLVFTTESRSVVMHAVFDESAILNHED